MKLNKIVNNWCKLIFSTSNFPLGREDHHNSLTLYNSVHRETASFINRILNKFESFKNNKVFQYQIRSYEVSSIISEILSNMDYIYRILMDFLDLTIDDSFIDISSIKLLLITSLKENEDPYLISRATNKLEEISRAFNNSTWQNEEDFPEILEKISEILELLENLIWILSKKIDTSGILKMSQNLKDLSSDLRKNQLEKYLNDLDEEELEEFKDL